MRKLSRATAAKEATIRMKVASVVCVVDWKTSHRASCGSGRVRRLFVHRLAGCSSSSGTGAARYPSTLTCVAFLKLCTAAPGGSSNLADSDGEEQEELARLKEKKEELETRVKVRHTHI